MSWQRVPVTDADWEAEVQADPTATIFGDIDLYAEVTPAEDDTIIVFRAGLPKRTTADQIVAPATAAAEDAVAAKEAAEAAAAATAADAAATDADVIAAEADRVAAAASAVTATTKATEAAASEAAATAAATALTAFIDQDVTSEAQFTARLDAGLSVNIPLIEVDGKQTKRVWLDTDGKVDAFETVGGLYYYLSENGYVTDAYVEPAVDADCSFEEAAQSLSLKASSATGAADGGTVELILGIGQSWMVGQKVSGIGDDSISTTAEHPGFALMPMGVTGLRGPRPDGGTADEMVDLVEDTTTAFLNETIMSGCASVYMTKLDTALGFKPVTIFAIAAEGGSTYEYNAPGKGIVQGAAIDVEAARIVDGAQSWAEAQGARLVVKAILFAQGEANYSNGTSRERYEFYLHQLQQRLEARCRAVTGQYETIPLLTYQQNWSTSAVNAVNEIQVAQLNAALRAPYRIHCIGPVYDVEAADDGHPNAASYRAELGCKFGHFLTQVVCGVGDEPLYVRRAYWHSTTTIDLDFTKDVTIETDDSKVYTSTLDAGKGIDFYDGDLDDTTASKASVSITGIAMVSGFDNRIRVTLSGAPTGLNPRLYIGMRRTAAGFNIGREGGARTAIRSTDAIHTDSLTGRTVYHWACHQVVELA